MTASRIQVRTEMLDGQRIAVPIAPDREGVGDLDGVASSLLYGQLNTAHPSLDPCLHRELSLLRDGSPRINAAIDEFLPVVIDEPPRRHEERKKMARYTNYFGAIVDQLVGHVFTQEVAVAKRDSDGTVTPIQDPFYEELSRDCDLQGHDLQHVAASALRDALVHGQSFLCVNLPGDDPDQYASVAQQLQAGGLRATIANVPFDSVVSWDGGDDDGSAFTTFVTRCESTGRASLGEPYKRVISFQVWTLENNRAVLRSYATRPLRLGEEPTDRTPCVMTSESVTTFTQVPIVRMRLDEGLWAGSKLRDPCIDVFQLDTALRGAIYRNLMPICLIQWSLEGGEGLGNVDPRRTEREAEFRAKGFMTVDAESDVKFVSPASDVFELTKSMLKEKVDAVYRVIQLMADSPSATDGASLSRSGTSKVQDRHATNVVVNALASRVRDLCKRAFACVAQMRGDGDGSDMEADGMSDYDLVDADELLQQSQLITTGQVQCHSPTAMAALESKVGLLFLGSNRPDQMSQVRQEVEEFYASPGQALVSGSAGTMQQGAVPPGGTQTTPVPNNGGTPTGQKQNAPGGGSAVLGSVSPQMSADANASGAPSLPSFKRAQSSTSGVTDAVYALLKADYPKEAIQWVKTASWTGPDDVPVDYIDVSGREGWNAATDDLTTYVAKQQDGTASPVVLINTPDDNKLVIADGHHRVLAALQAGTGTVRAYVASVGSMSGPWDVMHSQQDGLLKSPQTFDQTQDA